MLRKRQNRLAFVLLAAPLLVQGQPSAGEQYAIISRTREAALAYAGQLQNFLCVQTTVRSVDKDFLMPQTAEEIVSFGKTRTRARIAFDRYRKYEANSSIIFDDPPKP